MRLDDLELLTRISRYASFNAAANALGITQSAISKALIRLEEEAGGAIFQRTIRGVLITP